LEVAFSIYDKWKLSMTPATPKSARAFPEPPGKIEGLIQVIRFEPQGHQVHSTYAVTFTPYMLGSLRSLRSRYLPDETALSAFLQQIGVGPERIRRALDNLRGEDKTTIPDVTISIQELKGNGLLY